MTRDTHLRFLRAHQPMPDNPPPHILTGYKATTEFFYKHPEPEVIPLYLQSFAQWEDDRVYESVQSVLRRFSREKVVPHLKTGLTQTNPTIRFWCADTVRFFPDPSLADGLGLMLREGDVALRLVAASALEQIRTAQAARIAADAIRTETDEDVREILAAIVAD